MTDKTKKVGLIGLIAIVFTSMVGSSVYNLPQNMADGASAGAVLIAWIITGIGMYFLAQTFKVLSDSRPDITSGIYMYAIKGFGNYTGFNSAWGYWVSGAVGNVAFAVMLNDAVGYFYPPLLSHGWQTIVFSLVFIWLMTFIVMNGVEFATKINSFSTFVILMAMVAIIVVLAYYFSWDKFVSNFWSKGSHLGSTGHQVSGTMMVTLWSFIGIEGAVVIAGRAKRNRDIGKATIIGLFAALVIYMLVSLLSFGILDQSQLAALKTPSAGYVMAADAGSWATEFVNISVIISILISWLAWTVLVAEVPHDAARDGILPKIFDRENQKTSPVSALIITGLLMSIMMFIVIFANNVYLAAISIASVMIIPPYVLSAGYLWKAAEEKEIIKDKYKLRMKALGIGAGATLYGGWLLYSAGVNYLLMSSIFYMVGIPFYYAARKEDLKKGKVFSGWERILAAIIVIFAAIAVFYMFEGKLRP
ncbi:MAG: amino acid permease [Chlorobi bacterium]|nr:amino acid permease [Chlorobiota bacterium]